MAEASPKPRNFATHALDASNIDALKQLDKELANNPFDYYCHFSFISILHQGLQNHMYPSDGSQRDANSFELLSILRESYETMANKYPLGERLWEYRINDEKALARDIEERLSVLEICNKATQDEPYSAKLWVSYGDYYGHLIACSWEQNPPEQWSDEEKMYGKEMFQSGALMTVWRSGAELVKNNINDSSLVWDRYLELLEDDLDRGFSQEKMTSLFNLYAERLGQPHASWSNTLSKYASFNSRYNAGNYEELMEKAVQQNTHIKQQYTNREEYEFKLLQAIQRGDQDAEYHAITRYLKWEKKTMGVYSFHLVNALYERATLRFPVDAAIWEDHVEFLIWQNDRSVDIVNVLERATRHCPWSGSLWSHLILTLEAENRGFDEIERVKHTATGTGLLEHTDLEELIKVQIAWCGYLRRKAFDDPKGTEDDADIAEVGIRSALELVNETGMKKYGRKWPGDPKYRLERIHIKFWLQRGNKDEARHIWDSIVKQQQDSYDFWYRFYMWEMVVWANHAVRNTSNAGQELPTPSRATAVLERGMKRLHTIDQPESLIEMYINHCEQHESVLKVRSAIVERRRSERTVAIRRQKEMANAPAAPVAPTPEAVQENHVADKTGKRKREDTTVDELGSKKSKKAAEDANIAVAASVEVPARAASEAPSNTDSAVQTRDREHSTIIVSGLPAETTQTRIRQFFTDAGKVRNVVMKQDGGSMIATVEFETPDEADFAITKEAKGFEGNAITIKRGESTTLYIANYPAHADEAYLRKLFSPFGEIIEMRLPSLKYNAHRRFCYIQFASSSEAVAATKLDGTDVEGLKIVAKISDPNAKKQRGGATAEGREVYIWHLNFKVKKGEIKEAFSKYGTIENIKIPTMKNGNNKGFCYVIYSSKESAEAAVVEMDGKEFWGLDLKVQIADDKAEAKPKFKTTIENPASASTDIIPEETPGETADKTASAPAPVRDRSIALINVPDTVNDARIRALVEPFGYKKITLMPQHQGAIIEFMSVEGVGKAQLALEGVEITEGRKIRIGTVAELKSSKAEWKAGNSFVKPTNVKRPVARGGLQGGRGRGGKPGLGSRPRMPKATPAEGVEAKSNQDFRAMLLGKKDGEEVQKGTEMKE
jgi:RNA recognition motif-containing protein